LERHIHANSVLTIGEVAWLFNVNSSTVRRWADIGKIRASRIGRRGDRRFKREHVAQLMVMLGA